MYNQFSCCTAYKHIVYKTVHCTDTSVIRDLFYIPINNIQYVPSQIAFGFLYRVFVLFICSSLFSDSLESSSNHSCSDTPGLLVLLPTSAIILASCRLWSLCGWLLLCTRITMCNTAEYCTVALWNINTMHT